MSSGDDSGGCCACSCLDCLLSLIVIVALVWVIGHWSQFVGGVYHLMNGIFH